MCGEHFLERMSGLGGGAQGVDDAPAHKAIGTDKWRIFAFGDAPWRRCRQWCECHVGIAAGSIVAAITPHGAVWALG